MDPISRLTSVLQRRYAIDRELGAGGMATVYLANALKNDRKVALKVLKPELAAVVGSEPFLAEIKTTADLQHPRVCPERSMNTQPHASPFGPLDTLPWGGGLMNPIENRAQ